LDGTVTSSLKDLYDQYRRAVAAVCVVDTEKTHSIGTAFHVGDGVFVTARHVVADKRIEEVFVDRYNNPLVLRVRDEPLFHEDGNVDVAIFVVEPPPEALPALPLGTNWDDVINDDDFVLSKALMLGYPPIPLSDRAQLVAVSAEVNAVVDLRRPHKHVHYVLSATARGGFSGGPVISEWGFVLGMTTMSLGQDLAAEQLGFCTIVGVDPLWDCLTQNGLLPDAQSHGAV
jgi:S1-C subfamily serine protease